MNNSIKTRIWSQWSFLWLYLVVLKGAVCFEPLSVWEANTYLFSSLPKIQTYFETLSVIGFKVDFGTEGLNLYTWKYSIHLLLNSSSGWDDLTKIEQNGQRSANVIP